MKPKRKEGKVQTTIYLDPETLQALKDISARTLIPMAALIRKGIASVISEYSPKR